MTRYEMIYQINHSHYLERMQSTLWGRIDRFLSALIFFLGASVFASLKGTMTYGALIALFSAISFIYQFGKASAAADLQAIRYLQLIRNEPALTDEQLKAELLRVESIDTKAWHILEFAAQQRATIALGLKDDTPINLTRCQKIFSWLAGGLPNQADYLANNVKKPGEE